MATVCVCNPFILRYTEPKRYFTSLQYRKLLYIILSLVNLQEEELTHFKNFLWTVNEVLHALS